MLVTLLPLTLASDTQHRFKVYVRVFGDDGQAVRTFVLIMSMTLIKRYWHLSDLCSAVVNHNE